MGRDDNNNNQAFYSQASWSRLEMKPHEQKKGIKQERKRRGKTKGDKKPNQKKRKDNKTLSQKSEKEQEFFLTKSNKRKKPKIKILAHELLASTRSYLMLAPL
jgi:AAA15 family ATPase/GTPase